MWQQNQKPPRAGQKKSTSASKSGPQIHIKRVTAEIKLLGTDKTIVLDGRVILNELTPQGLSLFATELIPAGQQVAITLQEPRGIYLKGWVQSVADFNVTSHVLTSTPFQYRMVVKLVFASPEEEQKMYEFCARLKREHLYPVSSEDATKAKAA